MPNKIWQPEEMDELIKLFTVDKITNYDTLARHFKVGRGSIAGQCRKLGLRTGNQGFVRPRPPPRMKSDKPKKAKTMALETYIEKTIPVESRKLSLVELGEGCKYATHYEDQHLFCGQIRLEQSPYCHRHSRLAYSRAS